MLLGKLKRRRAGAEARQAQFRRVPLSSMCKAFKLDGLELKDIKCPIRPVLTETPVKEAKR